MPCLVLDATKAYGKGDRWVADRLDLPRTVVIVNKVDAASKNQVFAMLTAAAEAKAHVLMEKPFARTLEEADAMLAVAERHGIKVQVGHPYRPMPVVTRVRQMLLDGELGNLMEIRARGKEDRRAGGEDLMVLGTHYLDLMRYFAGDPVRVFAEVMDRGRPARTGHAASEPVGLVAGE